LLPGGLKLTARFELPFNLPTGAEIAMTNWSTPPMEQATSIQSLSHLFAIDDEELSSCTHLEYELDEAEEKLNNSQAHLQHDHPTSTATGPTVPPAYSTNPSAPSQPPAPPPPTFETPTRTKILTSSPIVTPPLSETNTALTCLVVDDDPLTRKLMYRMLSRMGHNIEMAEDGRSAFEILHQSWTNGPPIDIVFLDK
jgi:CheY-like chemotaxis protein